jgi:hypothetical protein
MNDLIRACLDITAVADINVRAKLATLSKVDAGEFFYCLGGAFSKLITSLGHECNSIGAADSFLEGFSSYRRFLKAASSDPDLVTPDGLSWLVDKDQSVN